MLRLHLVQVQALYFKALNSSEDSTVGVCFLDDPQNLTIRVVTHRNFDFPNTFPYDLIQYISSGTGFKKNRFWTQLGFLKLFSALKCY